MRDDEGDEDSKRYRSVDWSGGQIQCGGACDPRVVFTSWVKDKDQVMYQCTWCCDTVLCQGCYDVIQASRSSAGGTGEGVLKRGFCGADHGFVRAPVEGWEGIDEGMLFMNGEKPVRFRSQYVEGRLVNLLAEAWVEVWRGS